MGEEVTQFEASCAGCDETDKATPAPNDVSDAKNLIVRSEGINTNCDGSVCQPQVAEKSPKKASSVSSSRPQDNSFEKSKKWYNIGFMHRATSSRSATSDTKASLKMDNRHSWHLNDSVEMWVILI